MKFRTTGWSWTATPEDMPAGDSLQRIADRAKKIGFDGIDYLSDYDSLETFFTAEKCREIADYIGSIGMDIGALVFQSDRWNNPDKAACDLQFAKLGKCLAAAKNLGAGFISCIIPTPHGSRYNRRPSPSDKVASNLPSGYSWKSDWELFAGNMKRAAQMAQDYGLMVAMECFPRSLCSTPDAMLKLIADVSEKNFGIQLDTAHLMNQNIDIETAIFMLGAENIINIHAKDSDGLTRTNLAPGTGLIDYVAVQRALRNIGYKGSISVEVEFTAAPDVYMKLGLEHMKWAEKQI